MNAWEVEITALKGEVNEVSLRVDNLEERFDKHEERQNKSLEKIADQLQKMGARPTWAVSVALTSLVSLVTGLAVWMLTH